MAFYAGMSWSAVYEYLRALKNDPVSGAAYALEEWSVLEDESLRYYARAFLEFLLDNLEEEPNEQFVSALFHELYQVLFRHKATGSPFDARQSAVLKKLAAATLAAVQTRAAFQDWRETIVENVAVFLAMTEG